MDIMYCARKRIKSMTEDENNKQFVNIMEKLIIKYMLVRDRKQTKKTKKFLETTEDLIVHALHFTPMFFLIELNSNPVFNKDILDCQPGDEISLKEPCKVGLKKYYDVNREQIVMPMYTNSAYAGSAGSMVRLYPEDFIPIITNMPDVNLVLNPGVLGYPGVEISQELLSEEVSFHEKYDKPKKKTSIPFIVLSVIFIVFAAFVLTYSFINM